MNNKIETICKALSFLLEQKEKKVDKDDTYLLKEIRVLQEELNTSCQECFRCKNDTSKVKSDKCEICFHEFCAGCSYNYIKRCKNCLGVACLNCLSEKDICRFCI